MFSLFRFVIANVDQALDDILEGINIIVMEDQVVPHSDPLFALPSGFDSFPFHIAVNVTMITIF